MKSSNIVRGLVFASFIILVMSPITTTSAQSGVEEEDVVSTIASSSVSTEARVREYFADIPVMIEIARCESKFRQFTDSGAVLRGGGSGEFIGIFQFTESIHGSAALALGHNLATVEGNLAYARHLYTQQGTKPWSSCVPVTLPATDAQVQLKIKLMTKLIGLLQELLKLKLAGH